ncbi:transmembrane protein 235 [Gouania willdenowi]|uniref:transmembrane protein 235 n=1 Tax=Gouania willdenowi TaxID=441366 RepID=UPI0010559066|nr:transmembrane protein 114 [Gouania willdenowi]
MKVSYGSVVITAGIAGVLSFALLTTALGTNYWYIIQTKRMNVSDFEDMSSHSGLWSTAEGEKMYTVTSDSFTADYSKYSEPEQRMLNMHGAIVVMLTLSLVLMLFGGIFGLVSSLARSSVLLTCTASHFFICSLLTLCGASLYIIYSHQAEEMVGEENLAHVHTSFGWSLGLAWLSYGLELLTGLLLLTAAKMATRRNGNSRNNMG